MSRKGNKRLSKRPPSALPLGIHGFTWKWAYQERPANARSMIDMLTWKDCTVREDEPPRGWVSEEAEFIHPRATEALRRQGRIKVWVQVTQGNEVLAVWWRAIPHNESSEQWKARVVCMILADPK